MGCCRSSNVKLPFWGMREASCQPLHTWSAIEAVCRELNSKLARAWLEKLRVPAFQEQALDNDDGLNQIESPAKGLEQDKMGWQLEWMTV